MWLCIRTSVCCITANATADCGGYIDAGISGRRKLMSLRLELAERCEGRSLMVCGLGLVGRCMWWKLISLVQGLVDGL